MICWTQCSNEVACCVKALVSSCPWVKWPAQPTSALFLSCALHYTTHRLCSSLLQECGVRRGKVLAAADQYAQLINGAIETIVDQSVSSKHLAKSNDSSSQPAVRHIPLPPSIIANTEPFRHGDWRKEPYTTRSASLHQNLLAV